jgi:hypothetical protein
MKIEGYGFGSISHRHESVDPGIWIRIHTKMSWIRNTACRRRKPAWRRRSARTPPRLASTWTPGSCWPSSISPWATTARRSATMRRPSWRRWRRSSSRPGKRLPLYLPWATTARRSATTRRPSWRRWRRNNCRPGKRLPLYLPWATTARRSATTRRPSWRRWRRSNCRQGTLQCSVQLLGYFLGNEKTQYVQDFDSRVWPFFFHCIRRFL